MNKENSDQVNATFWDEPCGVVFAGEHGFDISSRSGLDKFDEQYLNFYPYLEPYLRNATLGASSVVEVGLGLGTVSRYLANRDLNYTGIDVAKGPCLFVERSFRERDLNGNFLNRSILDDRLADELPKFDVGIAIGSLHHTGDLEHALRNLENLIRPQGRLLIMVYNAFGLRRVVTRPHVAVRQILSYVCRSQSSWPELDQVTRGGSDTNSLGIPAPLTTYTTKRIFKIRHSHVTYAIRRENFHRIPLPKIMGGKVSRSALLGFPARIMGPDLYAEGVVQP